MAIANVQEVFSYTASGGGTTKSISISAPASGNTLVLIVQSGNGATVSSVSGGGVTWSKIASWVNFSGANTEIWAGANSSGSGTTISVVVSNEYARFDASVTEWSGMPSTLTTDGGSTQAQSTSSISTPSITPTASPCLLIAVANTYNQTVTAGPTGGFTAISTSGGSGFGNFAYQIADPASGSYSCGWTKQFNYLSVTQGIYALTGASTGGGASVVPILMSHYRRRRIA